MTNGYVRLLNSCKTEDLVIMCEKTSILPLNHFRERPGRATTDSIHLVVKLVKDTWRKGEVASLLCLDMKAVFPSAVVDILLQEMMSCRIPRGHVEWFRRWLEGRKMVLLFKDYRSEMFDINEGIDQGDAHSLIAWIVYNHQILKIFRKSCKETGFLFVNDTAILVTGVDFEDTHSKLRKVMTREGGVLDWAASHNCEFGMEKFQLLDLTRQKIKDLNRPRKRIALLRCNLYLVVVVPRILYGVDMFLGPALRCKSFRERKGGQVALGKLAAIQRSAALMIVGGLHTSPNDLLDMHANMLPFHLLVNKVQYQAALRLATLPNMHPLHKPVAQAARCFIKKHHSPLHELMFKFKLKPKLLEKIAAMRQAASWEPDIAIRIAGNKETAKNEDLADMPCIRVYTDGSSIEGQIGAAAVLYQDGVLKRKKRLRLELMKHHTVYEGEGIGLLLGLELIREEEEVDGLIMIGIDNTAAIKATHTIKPCSSHYIWDLFHQRVSVLSSRHKGADILIRWTPGHMGITGNERADKEAKKAAREGLSPSHRLLAPLIKTLPRSKSAA